MTMMHDTLYISRTFSSLNIFHNGNREEFYQNLNIIIHVFKIKKNNTKKKKQETSYLVSQLNSILEVQKEEIYFHLYITSDILQKCHIFVLLVKLI